MNHIIKVGIGILLVSVAFYFAYRSQNEEQYYNNISNCNFDEGNIQNCCVCLCDFDLNSNVIKLPCKHKFHKHCIREVFRNEAHNRRSCPLCRQHISESFVRSLF